MKDIKITLTLTNAERLYILKGVNQELNKSASLNYTEKRLTQLYELKAKLGLVT